MPKQNRQIAQRPGPVTLDVDLTAGDIRVHVEDRPHAEVIVSTRDDEGPSADAVHDTRISESGDRLTVRVPRTSGAGGVVIQGGRGVSSIVSTGGASFVQVGGVVGDVWVNGVRISGGGAVVVGGSPIVVEARLPLGSSLAATSTSTDVEATGRLVAARVQSVSGDITLDAVDRPDLRTTSGDIEIAALHGDADLAAVSGDIRVHADVPCRVRANTVSGDVRVTGARVDLDARSVSGRVRQS